MGGGFVDPSEDAEDLLVPSSAMILLKEKSRVESFLHYVIRQAE
jgi:Mg2+/Co2+ transporter CorC